MTIPLLYRVAHDFGQILAHPPGNVHCANIRKDVALQAGHDLVGVVF